MTPLRHAAILAIAASSAFAQPAIEPGQTATVTLSSGEILRATCTARDADSVTLNHPVLGTLRIENANITDIQAVADDAAPLAVRDVTPTPAPPVPSNAELSFLKGWSGSFEFGLTGSSGNSERIGLRGGLSGRRTTLETDTSFSLRYIYARDSGSSSENRGVFDIRNDWLFQDSPWRIFALGRAEYDQFQDWDWRLSAFGGVGYEFIKNDKTTLIGRVGAGLSREFGGTDDDITPEGLLGLDFEHKLADNQKLFAVLDFFPALDDFGPYRFNAKAGYEIIIDPESQMALRLGIEDRYDSSPGPGNRRNDLDYFAIIVFNF